MEIEKLKVSHTKRNILIGGIIIILLIGITLTFTRAKYRTTQSIPLLNGTINYELSDLNLIGAYIQEGEEYVKTDTIPTSGYEFNAEESYCTINNERDDNITLSFDMTTQNLTVTPLTTKGTKCYLYFDEKLSAGDTILAASKPQGQTTDWTGQTTYYYTGNPNNWVQFGTNSSGQSLYWRIIRINGDGTIRMIYQGTGFNTTGTATQIGTSAFNSSYNNNMYVGFKYTSNQVHGTGTNSTILNTLNNWYASNLADEAEYLDGNAGFCGDRTPSTSRSSSNGRGGTGTTETYYGAFIRLSNKGTSNSNPSLQCDSQDVYTTTDSSSGNKSLQYPIGLVTADEAALTGITWNDSNTGSYLYTGQDYWTMSPWYFDSTFDRAHVFNVNYYGNLNYGWAANSNGVRPVINLKSAIAITGEGSVDKPFKIQ